MNGSISTPERVRFARAVVLTKEEVFEACSVLSLAESELRRAGRILEAASAAAMFAVMEGRLAADVGGALPVPRSSVVQPS